MKFAHFPQEVPHVRSCAVFWTPASPRRRFGPDLSCHHVWRRLDTARFEHEEWDLADAVIVNLLQLRTAALGPTRPNLHRKILAAIRGEAVVSLACSGGSV